jgi:hypothetical protein
VPPPSAVRRLTSTDADPVRRLPSTDEHVEFVELGGIPLNLMEMDPQGTRDATGRSEVTWVDSGTSPLHTTVDPSGERELPSSTQVISTKDKLHKDLNSEKRDFGFLVRTKETLEQANNAQERANDAISTKDQQIARLQAENMSLKSTLEHTQQELHRSRSMGMVPHRPQVIPPGHSATSLGSVSASPRAAMRTQQQSPTVLRVGESSGALVGVPTPIACGERKTIKETQPLLKSNRYES